MQAPPAQASAEPDPRAQTRLLLVLGFCGFASSLSLRAVDPMLPLVSGDLAVTTRQAALLASAYALPYALGQLFMGALGDAVGKARTISVCVALLAVLLFAAALAPDFPLLLGARIAAGIAGGGIIPLCLALIGDRFAVKVRQVAIGRFLFVSISGQMLGAAGSGVLAEAIGWRGVFAASGLISAVIAASAFLVLRPKPGVARRKFGIGSIVASNAEVLRSPGAPAFYLTMFLEGALIFAALPFIAAFLGERDGITPSGAGLVLAAMGVGTAAYSAVVGLLLRRLGTTGLRLWGALLAGGLLALLAVPMPLPATALLFFGYGFGFMMLHNTLQMTATELAPAVRGTALSLFAMSLFLGQGVGPVVLGAAAAVLGLPLAFALTGALIVVLGAAAAAAIRRA